MYKLILMTFAAVLALAVSWACEFQPLASFVTGVALGSAGMAIGVYLDGPRRGGP